MKNGEGDIEIEFENNVCSLSIGQCEVDDEGTYSCMVENELGKASCSTKLEVQGKRITH